MCEYLEILDLNLEINDGKLFLDSSNKNIFIQGRCLCFKNIRFKYFKWDNKGIQKVSTINTIIINNKVAYVLSKSYMQQLANDYNIKGSFEGISFINCMFEYEPNIEKNGFHKIVFEKCIFLEIQTDLTKHLLSNIDEQRRRILFDECKFDNFQLGDITDIQYKQNVELCKFDFFGEKLKI